MQTGGPLRYSRLLRHAPDVPRLTPSCSNTTAIWVMSTSRRNLYRILYVQPEAPIEVIRASYRTLIGPLGFHPDKGGDHEAAARINSAYSILTDPVRRRAYDKTLGKENLRGRGRAGSGDPAQPTAAAIVVPVHPGQWRERRECPFCRYALPSPLRPASRCTRCDAPLWPPIQDTSRGRELFGRRNHSRTGKDLQTTVVPAWGARPNSAVLRDLSLTGCHLVQRLAVATMAVVRMNNAELDAVVLVLSCRKSSEAYSIRGQLLTVMVKKQSGIYFNAVA